MGDRRGMYERMYRTGRARWDTGITPPEVVELIEGPGALRPGRALDLGCGTGTNAVYLRGHGWDVVGVDFSELAIDAASTKAEGVEGVRFVRGDVTRLGDLGVEGPFDFLLDIGCFHGLARTRRGAYVDGVARVAGPGATFALFAWGPWRPWRSRRTRRAEVDRRFGRAFETVREIAGSDPPGAAWFVLRRR